MAAWMFYDERDPMESLSYGVLTTHGSKDTQGSHQNKLSRVYGIMMTIGALRDYHQVNTRSILVICKKEAALNKSLNPWISNPLDKQFEIIHAIRVGIRVTNLKWTTKHLKWHQDEAVLALFDEAQWNAAMD